MVKRTLSIAVLMFAVVAFTTPNDAQAQQQDVGQAAFGNLIAALNNINAQVRALENVDVDVQDVQVVNIGDIQDNLNQNQIEVLNNALQNADIDALQNFLNDNEVIKNSLNQNDVTITDVVAIDVLSGGDIVVYVQ